MVGCNRPETKNFTVGGKNGLGIFWKKIGDPGGHVGTLYSHFYVPKISKVKIVYLTAALGNEWFA